jgi:hypothetical protein
MHVDAADLDAHVGSRRWNYGWRDRAPPRRR